MFRPLGFLAGYLDRRTSHVIVSGGVSVKTNRTRDFYDPRMSRGLNAALHAIPRSPCLFDPFVVFTF